MDEKIYLREDGLDRVWQYSIMPLLEDLFYGQHDLADRYGLASLRDAVGAATSLHQPAPLDAAPEPSNDMP
jgi:hypothetical protein